jgi:hypothetical protein
VKTAVKKWSCDIKITSIIRKYKLFFIAGPSTLKEMVIMWKTREQQQMCPCMLVQIWKYIQLKNVFKEIGGNPHKYQIGHFMLQTMYGCLVME